MEREDEEKSYKSLFEMGLVVGDERKDELFGVLAQRNLGPKNKETELRLCPPGGECVGRETHPLDHYPCVNLSKVSNSTTKSVCTKRVFLDTVDGFSTKEGNAHNKSGRSLSWSSSFSAPPSVPVLPSKQPAFPQFKQNTGLQSMTKPAVENTSMGASEQRPAVGWPPLRSFRKNFASSSSIPSRAIQSSGASIDGSKAESCKKGLFVKINMDGVPIGRKVDLGAYDSYQKLSDAVDELFRSLRAAQRDTLDVAQGDSRDEKPITGLLDGSGEYTLVYEDDEGDRMLVGDVPWGMFVKSVKRLRVLKSSDLSGLLVFFAHWEIRLAVIARIVVPSPELKLTSP